MLSESLLFILEERETSYDEIRQAGIAIWKTGKSRRAWCIVVEVLDYKEALYAEK